MKLGDRTCIEKPPLDEGLKLGVHGRCLILNLVELNFVVKRYELFKSVMGLVFVFGFEVLKALHDWAVDFVGDVVEPRKAVLNFISTAQRVDHEVFFPLSC